MLPCFKNIFFIVLLGSLVSCKKLNTPANDAIFINSGEIKVAVKAGQGFGSHKFTDLWLYTNGFFRGVYPVGSKMPVMLNDGVAKVEVFPGIMSNGISTTRTYLKLFESIKFDTILPSGTNIIRNFTFKYKDNVSFPWIEDFELPGYSLIKSTVSDTTYKLHINDADVFQGNKSVEFGLSGSGTKLAQLESAASHSLPLGASSENVYLEIDYKCNAEFEVGVISSNFYRPVLTISPKSDWNKIYVFLGNAINLDNTTALKKIAFRVYRNDNVTISEQKVYLDNIKLVYL